MDDSNCVLGEGNKQRIVSLERDVGRIQKWITSLIVISFSTLGSAVIALTIALLKK